MRIIQRSDELMGVPPASQVAGMGQLRVPEDIPISGVCDSGCGQAYCPAIRTGRNPQMLGRTRRYKAPTTKASKIAKKLKRRIKNLQDELQKTKRQIRGKQQKASALTAAIKEEVETLRRVEGAEPRPQDTIPTVRAR